MNTYRPDANWWRRSSFCGASAGCVDVRRDGDKIQVRDSKVAPEDALVLSWSVDEWRELLDAIRRGTDHDDLTEDFAGVWIGSGHYLFFGPDEWTAFVKGVKVGEFEPERLSGPTSSEGYDAGQPVGVGGGSNQIAATGAGGVESAPGEPVP
ncbi:MAG: hypothetical protein JWO67_2388, partial [Streptosporangiaceae bacterium]|nr:hypothetical protein [Streptosporangiaceae bacterium]